MPSIKELKDELKRLGISKGLSKLTKPQLENLIKKANKPHTVNTLQDRKDLLSTISKGNLLKVIRIIRITNYSHLKHDELIDLIASKYWSDFHTRWFNQAPDELLPNKPAKPLPKPSFSFPPEEKKEAPKKKQQNPKKDDVKEEHKHDDNLNLEELGDIELTVWEPRPNIIHGHDIDPDVLEAYVRTLEKVLIKIKNGKLKTPKWEKETAIRLQEEAIKVLKDYMKQYRKGMFKEFPNLPKNLSFRNTFYKYSDALYKSQDGKEKPKVVERALKAMPSKPSFSEPKKKKAEKTSKEKQAKPKQAKPKPKPKEAKPKQAKPEEKKEDDIPTTFLKATQYIRNMDKSDRDLAKRKIMLVLTNFKGNKEFYEKNKASIDSLTPAAFRKRMGFS